MSAHSFGLCAYFLIGLLLRVGCEPLTAPLCLGLILTFVSWVSESTSLVRPFNSILGQTLLSLIFEFILAMQI